MRRHTLNYYVDRDCSVDMCYIETYEFTKASQGKLIRSEPIEIEDLNGLYVGIKIFLEDIKRYKGKWMLKKKALEKFREENPDYLSV